MINRSFINACDNSHLLKDRSLSGLRAGEDQSKLDTSTFLPLRSRKPVPAPVNKNHQQPADLKAPFADLSVNVPSIRATLEGGSKTTTAMMRRPAVNEFPSSVKLLEEKKYQPKSQTRPIPNSKGVESQ